MLDVLYVSSAGGHFTELKIIIQSMKEKSDFSYLVCSEKNRQTINDDSIDVYLKYGSRSKLLKYMYISVINTITAFKVIAKHRPKTIISTGAHSCVVFFVIGKLFGTKNIYIESFAKVKSPSLTYKLAKKFIDIVYVQHEEMLNVYPKGKCVKGVY